MVGACIQLRIHSAVGSNGAVVLPRACIDAQVSCPEPVLAWLSRRASLAVFPISPGMKSNQVVSSLCFK